MIAAASGSGPTTELDDLRELQRRTAAERDRLGADLVRVEQALARAQLRDVAAATRPSEVEQLARSLEAALRHVELLTDQLARMEATLSWRVTAPLRRVRRYVPGR